MSTIFQSMAFNFLAPIYQPEDQWSVNAHLRSAAYTNFIENSPSIGAGEALGPLFFQNNQ